MLWKQLFGACLTFSVLVFGVRTLYMCAQSHFDPFGYHGPMSRSSQLQKRDNRPKDLMATTARLAQFRKTDNTSTDLSFVNSTKLGYLEFQHGDQRLTALLQEKCQDKFNVPPIVHYVWLDKTYMQIHEYISFLSARRFLGACFILIHGNVIPRGKWWDRLLAHVPNIIRVKRESPKTIFNRTISWTEHKTDVLRLQVLLEYGGIYLDTDMYVLRSFDPLRHNDVTLCREDTISVASSVILARPGAPFLTIWYLAYHTYTSTSWARNSVKMANHLSRLLPEMVNVEQKGMIKVGPTSYDAYYANIDWDNSAYSVHLYARVFKRLDWEIDELKTLNNTFGAMSRFILFGSREIIEPVSLTTDRSVIEQRPMINNTGIMTSD